MSSHLTPPSASTSLLECIPSSALAPTRQFTPAHQAFREQVRAFVEQYLTPDVIERCERTGGVSKELIKKSYESGIFAMRGPVELGGTPPAHAEGDIIDAFYEYVLVDELASCGSHGVVLELIGNFGMLVPILQTFASDEIKESIIKPMVRADLFVCFAFTEPPMPTQPITDKTNKVKKSPNNDKSSPSFVSRRRLRTMATLRPDGSYELTGEKMYISFAARSDYILTACTIVDRDPSTGELAPSNGISLILVPSALAGVTITPLHLHGWNSTSTTRIQYRSVRVPAKFVLINGAKAGGEVMPLLFNLLRSNINQERFITAVMAMRSSRLCLDASIRFSQSKRLSPTQLLSDTSHARQQIVHMSSIVQQNRLLVESLTAHLAQADAKHTNRWSSAIAQQTALTKYACTRGLNECVNITSNLLGSSGIMVGGNGDGGLIERIRRDAAVNATTGGSEGTLLEFVAKKAKL